MHAQFGPLSPYYLNGNTYYESETNLSQKLKVHRTDEKATIIVPNMPFPLLWATDHAIYMQRLAQCHACMHAYDGVHVVEGTV